MRERNTHLVLTLIAAQMVVMLDSSVLNVAIPSIARDLNLSAIGTAWVLNAYFITFGGLLLISGRAADVLGRRRMFLAGSSVLVLGSVLGVMASSGAELVIARLLQGAGAATLSPAAMSVILSRFEGLSRARVMSWWGAASTVGGAIGVSVGGVLAGNAGWHSVMLMTGVVAAILAVAGWVLLPADERGERREFDVRGASSITAGAVAVVFGVLSAPSVGLVSVEVVLACAVAATSVVIFVRAERKAGDPILPLQALRDRRVSGGVVVNMLGGAARVACFVLVALLIQQVLEFSPASAGLAMLPTSVAGFAVSTVLLPRALMLLGAQRVAILGLGLLVVAHLVLASVNHGDSYVVRVLPALVLAATGVAFSFTPTTLVIADGMAARNAGVSSGLASATAQIGGAMGIAVFGAVDSAMRVAALERGEGVLATAHAGVSAAHIAAAVVAALAAAIGLVAFTDVSRPRKGSGRRVGASSDSSHPSRVHEMQEARRAATPGLGTRPGMAAVTC